jgi:AcrR family transcriptional regulator
MAHATAPTITKGGRTRSRILDEAASLASVGGIGSVTLGHLAERLGMSKSGLFAHFDSKEALQVEILDRAATSSARRR